MPVISLGLVVSKMQDFAIAKCIQICINRPPDVYSHMNVPLTLIPSNSVISVVKQIYFIHISPTLVVLANIIQNSFWQRVSICPSDI